MELEMRVRFTVLLAAVCAITVLAATEKLEETFGLPLDHKAIQYNETAPNDPAIRLFREVEQGKAKLTWQRNGWGYLVSLLDQLGIDKNSQVLVFSQTSIQIEHISPRTPRAIYFNDNVSVGYVQGGDVLEISALDTHQGIQFYTLKNRRPDEGPDVARRDGSDDCMRCHRGPQTLGVPGRMVSSVYSSPSDVRGLHAMSYVTDDRVPIEQRWGGWYISGALGNQKHLGVAIAPDTERFDSAAYVVPTSDVVALLTLEHQARMTNLITRVGWDTRIAEADKKMSVFSEQLDYEIGELVKYMTFAGEAPLAGPIQGASSFAKTFTAQGPRDKQGRSLRDFDLEKKVFRYPVSYMIYSPAFDALPDTARSRIYQRLFDILRTIGDGPSAIEILRQTKDGLPDYFRNPAPGH
jgi:hypothetical protein